ncbi:MAG: hypothetical protein RLZZ28_1657 [Bacteroidota bacterium]|jgi:hypothetical protein
MLATFEPLKSKHLIFCADMTRKPILVLFVLLLMFSSAAFSQQVNGHWFGLGVIKTSNEYDTYLSELVIRQKGKNIWGELNYYFKDSLVKVPIAGSFNDQSRVLQIQPFPMIYYRSPNARNSIDCYLSGNFSLVVSKTESVLTGILKTDEAHKYTVPDIKFKFTRSNDTLPLLRETPIAEKTAAVKTEPMAATVAPVLITESALIAFEKREKVFTKELEVNNDSLRIEIYDNGQIDYDSVSLFLNNRQVLKKSMLTHRAIRLTLALDPLLEFNELSMLAENLGMVPPNTAALVIYDGKLRYETLLSSDLNKTATIRIRKKK